eukprot:PITA_21031
MFYWNEDYLKSLDVFKGEMVTTPILVFLDWKKEFHVHVDTSCIALGAVLTQADEGELDHPIAFTSRRLSKAEKNYSTTECKGLAMVYVLQKFRHYLLGGHFKMYTNHSTLKYLVNKTVLGGRICRWLLLFQEYDFEVIVKLGQLNATPNHLSCIETGEEPTNLEEGLPDAQLFAVCVVDGHFEDIIHFLMIGTSPEGYTTQQKMELVVKKHREKAWYDQHIKLYTFKVNDLVLLYDIKFDKFLGKFRMHWLGPYVNKEINDGGAIQLVKLNGDTFPGRVNDSRLKPYIDDPAR